MLRDENGRIITFYSYKGGTGRSMALANVAWILASAGKKVLTIDWDFEAPGLHRYFHPFLRDPELRQTDGLIDLVLQYVSASIADGEKASTTEWLLPYADVMPFVVSLDWPFHGAGRIDFLGAGRQDNSYAVKVNTFDWQAFYRMSGGAAFFEAIKDEARRTYQYILIDSRTGVSDTSGICTVQMPDSLVTCFTLNYQSIDGICGILGSVQRSRSDRPLELFPVPTRVDPFEKDKLDARRRYYRSRLSGFLVESDRSAPEEYWKSVEAPYIPYYGYEEILAAFGDEPGNAQSLLAQAEFLTSRLTNGEVSRLVPPDAERRDEVLLKYQRRTAEDVASDLATIADDIFSGLGAGDQAAAGRMLTRLVRLARPGEPESDTTVRVAIDDLGAPTNVIQAFSSRGVLLLSSDATVGQVATIGTKALLHRWARFANIIAKDRPFLLWRQQQLGAALSAYQSSGRDQSALLSGDPLQRALDWLAQRPDDFSVAERTFINRSKNERDRQLRLEQEQQVNLQRLDALTRNRPIEVWPVKSRVERRRSLILGVLAAVVPLAITIQVWRMDRRTQREDQLQEFIRLARQASRAGVNLLARDYADSAVQRSPTNPEALEALGVAYARLDQPKLAAPLLDSAISLGGPLPRALTQRGLIRAADGDTAGAVRDLSAVPADSMTPDALDARGHIYEAKGRLGAAINDYSAVIRRLPSFSNAYLDRGGIYETLGKRDSAVADYRAAITASMTDTSSGATNAALIAAARLRRLGIVAPAAAQRRLTLAIHYNDRADSVRVDSIARGIAPLLSSLRLRVLTSKWRPERTTGEVRYLQLQDLEASRDIKDAVEKLLASQGFSTSLKVVRIDTSQYTGTGGLVEVWLPPLRVNRPLAR